MADRTADGEVRVTSGSGRRKYTSPLRNSSTGSQMWNSPSANCTGSTVIFKDRGPDP